MARRPAKVYTFTVPLHHVHHYRGIYRATNTTVFSFIDVLCVPFRLEFQFIIYTLACKHMFSIEKKKNGRITLFRRPDHAQLSWSQ